MGAVLFVTGGARSGKSAFAQRLAEASARPVVFVATMEPLDAELAERVARHRSARPASWRTIEEPFDLGRALVACERDACVLLDCLSLWVTNRMMPLGDPPALDALAALESELDSDIDALLETQSAREGELIVVTNEVGGGVVPPSALGRAYRDLLGRTNQRFSAGASRAWLLVAGRALELPPPV
ncbi:MAG: bifunctional adenosylcobinamide kinase/adenosylcobinamide-phosphate guanylyltransferase [Dehalococcoidia bacterium]